MSGFEQLQEGGRFFGISGSFIGLGGGRGQGSGSVWVSRQYDLIAIFFYNFIVFWSVVWRVGFSRFEGLTGSGSCWK